MSSARHNELDLLARLIAFNTTSSNPNRPLADFICDYLSTAQLERFDGLNGKTNLIARVGPPTEGGLVLCGHMDVVPADEPDWQSDPFELSERDGRLFGRGACDMKGFLALAINVLAAGSLQSGSLKRPLALLLTHDEEIGGIGAQHLAREWTRIAPLPRSVIIGEPTGLTVVRMHKGHLKLRITVRGRPAHSGLPHMGINAIERSIDVLQLLRAQAEQWRSRRPKCSEYFPECPFPVLNIGMLHAGSAVNIVPEQAVIDLGIRLLPGQASTDAIAEVEKLIQSLPAETHGAVALEVINDNPPLLCDDHAPVNRVLCELLGQSDSRGVSFASDAGILSSMGLQCVLWGPGDMKQAHRSNEYLDVEQFQIARRRLDEFVNRFCRE